MQPILAGECSHCHGANADRLGDARTGGGFRLDFYDMKQDVCGEATRVLGAGKAARVRVPRRHLGGDHAPADKPNERPRMPPAPGALPGRLGVADDPALGRRRRAQGRAAATATAPPRFRLYHDSGPADRTLDITAVIEDPDGDPIVGVLQFGDVTLNMDRGGAFSATLDTSSWPAGERAITAVLCDGWSSVSYAVGTLVVSHAP